VYYVCVNIALIPARSGSKRLPGKNIKLLNGKHLIYYTIKVALESKLFSEVIVSTDSKEIADIAKIHGANVPLLRPSDLATDSSTDIEWVNHAINSMVKVSHSEISSVSILRPTNPLRTSATISKALKLLESNSWADSVRAMEITDKHPGKMWVLDEDKKAYPYLDQSGEVIPTHNKPTQSLQTLWVQNASLEIIKFKSLMSTKSISGNNVLGYEMPGLEGFDINTQKDFEFLEFLISRDPYLIVNKI
jgi:CMP-N,N'-diacetyllegionaminic acid synthase